MSVIVVALFVAFLWGVAPVIQKHVLKSVDFKVIMVISGIFYSFALIIFGLMYRTEIVQGMKNLDRVSLGWIAFTSIATGFFANLIYLFILRKHESYVIAALIYASPIFTLILAYLYLHEKITLMGFIGVLLIVMGVVALAFNEKGHSGTFASVVQSK